ncbi:hypothetical protein BST61_g2758 [Cercospora zeina]
MTKFTLFATLAILLSGAAAREAAVPTECCKNQLASCKAQGDWGCVYLDHAYCVVESSDNACKDACRQLLNLPSGNNNFYLYTPENNPNVCACSQFDASTAVDPGC